MVIAIWYGDSKPILNEYIESFVTEMISLLETGLFINGHHVKILVGLIICDTPARAMLKGFYLLLNPFITNHFKVHVFDLLVLKSCNFVWGF